MAWFPFSDLPYRRRKGGCFLLAFCWIAGLVCGIWVCLSAGSSFSSWMRSTVYGSVSIVSLHFVTILPFLLSAFAFFISSPALLLAICFCKAFFLSFISLGVYQAFGSAGWLIRHLLLFSDCMSAPLLYWYWRHHLLSNDSFCVWKSACVLALSILIGSINYCIISPFLASLIDF